MPTWGMWYICCLCLSVSNDPPLSRPSPTALLRLPRVVQRQDLLGQRSPLPGASCALPSPPASLIEHHTTTQHTEDSALRIQHPELKACVRAERLCQNCIELWSVRRVKQVLQMDQRLSCEASPDAPGRASSSSRLRHCQRRD